MITQQPHLINKQLNMPVPSDETGHWTVILRQSEPTNRKEPPVEGMRLKKVTQGSYDDYEGSSNKSVIMS